jgi:Fe-S cluster biogenesis protein NfuA
MDRPPTTLDSTTSGYGPRLLEWPWRPCLPSLRRIEMRDQVEKTILVIRPALQADGGDIVLKDVDEATGVVTVELVGACVGCPASTQTLKAGIERIMRDRVDGVTEVVNIGDEAA